MKLSGQVTKAAALAPRHGANMLHVCSPVLYIQLSTTYNVLYICALLYCKYNTLLLCTFKTILLTMCCTCLLSCTVHTKFYYLQYDVHVCSLVLYIEHFTTYNVMYMCALFYCTHNTLLLTMCCTCELSCTVYTTLYYLQ